MNRITEYRKKRGLTQLALAIKTELHPSGLSRIEMGVRCKKETALKIATALDEDVRDVFPNFETLRGN